MSNTIANKKYPEYESSEQWLAEIRQKTNLPDLTLLQQACEFLNTHKEEKAPPLATSCRNQGFIIANTLCHLECDINTLVAGLLLPLSQYNAHTKTLISQQFPNRISQLIQGVERVGAINTLRSKSTNNVVQQKQIDQLRKMQLAMVSDIRVVLIKLAEQLSVLRYLRFCPPIQQKTIARQTMDVIAPLANRLGIGELKWQLEDLAFRTLQPERYKEISTALKMRRDEREQFIKEITKTLNEMLSQQGIENFSISGRPKHIFSIHKKIEKKQLPMDEIYDISAVRVVVDSIEDCYNVLALVHERWPHVSKEFDDYIAKPKSNGYRSIHTVIKDPSGHHTEIQIRTKTMHQEAEFGVAAHWNYKEDNSHTAEYADKISWLHEILDWRNEISSEVAFDDAIYVFTPAGDIFDLSAGATALDFAYRVHTDVGHRCRGAKVNGQLVPLTHNLKTGDQVEILTQKNHAPSRDWLNPHSGYLHTQQARSKVKHWFRQLDYAENLEHGISVWEKANQQSHYSKQDLAKAVDRFNFKKVDDMLAALGAGDVSCQAIMQYLNRLHHKPADNDNTIALSITTSHNAPLVDKGMRVEGITDLLTQIARCCKPIPGDPVLGYVTQGRGVTVHHRDCRNLQQTLLYRPERLIAVDWGNEHADRHPVDIAIEAYDRNGLLRDISGLIASENLTILGFSSRVDKMRNLAFVHLTIEISSLHSLQKVLQQIKQVEGVLKASR